MPLHVPATAVPEQAAEVGGYRFTTKAVYGESSSLMIATRPPGYHSSPHFHHCEQLNWLQSGEVWIFVGADAHLMRPGDFLRIPSGAVHWAWNKADASCTLVEVHSPGMQADPTIAGFAVGLFDAGEQAQPSGSPVNEFVPEDAGFDRRIAEKKAE